jgi:hypothetical protein
MRLEFGVGVRADFAVQIDLFMLRCGPFHERRSFDGVMQDPERVAQVTKEGNTDESQQVSTGRLRAEKELLHIDKMERVNRSGS